MRSRQPVKPRRSLFRRLVRVTGRILLVLLIIVLLVFILVQTPYVQNIVRGKAESYLSRKLNTRVRIGHLDIELFRSVTLRDVYIGDRSRDTLLSAGLIAVQVRMLGLLHHHLDIGVVHLADLTAKIRRQGEDTAFNFQFIVDAFAAPASAKPAKAPGAPMKIDLKELDLDRVRLVYKDTVSGNDVAVWIGHSMTRTGLIDLDHSRFDIPAFDLENMQAKVWKERPRGGLETVATPGGRS